MNISMCTQCQRRCDANIFDGTFYFFLKPKQWKRCQDVREGKCQCCVAYTKWSQNTTDLPGHDVDKMMHRWKHYLKCNRVLINQGIRDKRSAVTHWYKIGKGLNLQCNHKCKSIIQFTPCSSTPNFKQVKDVKKITDNITVQGWSKYMAHIESKRRIDTLQQQQIQERLKYQAELQSERQHVIELTNSIRNQQEYLQRIEQETTKRLTQQKILQELEAKKKKMLTFKTHVEESLTQLRQHQIQPFLDKPQLLESTVIVEYRSPFSHCFIQSIFQHYEKYHAQVLLVLPSDMEYDFYIPAISKSYNIPFVWTHAMQKNTHYNYHAKLKCGWYIDHQFFHKKQEARNFTLDQLNHMTCLKLPSSSPRPYRFRQSSFILFKPLSLPRLKNLLHWRRKREASGNENKPSERVSMPGRHICFPSEQYLYKYVDHVYILNLLRRPDRFSTTVNRLHHEGIYTFEHFYAEDCREVQYTLLFETYNFLKQTKQIQPSPWRVPSKGSFAILYSMWRMLEDAIANEYENILVLQDDIFCIDNFRQKFTNCLETAPDWKLLYIGANDKKLVFKRMKDPPPPFYFPGGDADGAFAIIIKRCLFQTILDSITFQQPFDSGPLRHMQRRFTRQCPVAYPNLIIADVSESDCRENRPQEAFSKRVLWDMTLYTTTGIPMEELGRLEIVIIHTEHCTVSLSDIRNIFESDAVQCLPWNITVFSTQSFKDTCTSSGSRSWNCRLHGTTSKYCRWYCVPQHISVSQLQQQALKFVLSPHVFFQTMTGFVQRFSDHFMKYLQNCDAYLATSQPYSACVLSTLYNKDSATTLFGEEVVLSKFFVQKFLDNRIPSKTPFVSLFGQFLEDTHSKSMGIVSANAGENKKV